MPWQQNYKSASNSFAEVIRPKQEELANKIATAESISKEVETLKTEIQKLNTEVEQLAIAE